MKRILSLCLLLLAIMAAQAQDTRYKLTLNVPADGTLQANAYGTSIYDRRLEYAAGEEVHLTGSLRSEYSCTGWTDEQGTLVCDSLRYTFTMPARDVTLTGHTEYNPENPPGPREDGYTDTWNRLYLRSNPSYGGAFTWGLGAQSEQNWLVWTGYEFTVQAYPNTGFYFKGWELDGKIVSTDNPYTFPMPERDMTLYAVYEYDPETPANPHANVWDKESGELIVSDFIPGHLYEKIGEVTSRDPWHSDWNLIKSATIAGPSTDESLTYDYPIDIYAFARNASNVAYLDYSRTSGITKVPNGCFSIYALKHMVLPATIEVIGNYAFRNCTNLTEVTCFATTPPAFDGRMPGDQGYSTEYYSNNWAFDGLKLDDIIIHVPAEAVPLYQAARGWKEFMILPITQQVSRITVSLPQAEIYKDMFLELVNTKTLQSQRYVITNSTTYTFNNVIHGTSHHLYIKNARGDIMGRIENIDVTDHDVQVSFDGLKAPCNVAIQLTTHDGTDVTSHATITWTDRQGNFLKTGSIINGQVEGSQIRYHVKLDESLGKQYLTPPDSLYTIGSSSVINCQLAVLPQLTISGIVRAADTELPIHNATVAVSQLLNSAYTVTQTAKTDVNGHYELTVYDTPTTITVTHSNYLKASLTTDSLSFPREGSGVDFALRDLTGTIIGLDLYYRPAVHDDEESISKTFDSPGSVNYTVYDETHKRDITNFSEQYPLLVLTDQELDEGTLLRVTATSKTESFMPVTATCTVNGNGRATAILGITELGRIEASFETTDNMSVMGLLYDGEGHLKGWSGYNDTQLNIFNLPDGHYTLVTMGSNNLFNACNTFSALEQTGVLEHNAVVNELTLTSGHIVVVQNQSIPLFDEDAFRMTSDAATLSVNKSEVTVGQYVTLRASVAFKPAYASQTDLQLLFDLPEGCSLVENSVMVGNGTAAYQTDGNRVIVPLANISDDVRFCVVSTHSGSYLVSASVATGQTAGAQPFGTVLFSATDLTINVVEKTARRSIPVTGMAVPLSQVQVYDNGTLIGETTSLGTGSWSLMCPLDKAYNLSEHSIYAVVITSEGLQIQSETKTVKVDRAGLTPVVSCRLQSDNFEHKHFDFKWDFRTNEVSPTFASLTTSAFNDCQQTFEVNFYDENDMVANDTTVIRDVTLYVKTSRGDIRTYPLNYSLRHKSWWIHLDWKDRLPINVDLDYTVASDVVLDRQQLEDAIAEAEANYEENRQMIKEVYADFTPEGLDAEQEAAFRELDDLLDRDNLNDAALARRDSLFNVIIDDPDIIAKAEAKYAIDFSEVDALYKSLDPNNPDPETVLLISKRTREIMANATQPETDPDEAEMAAERTRVQALTDSIAKHAGTFRDAVLNSMEWLVQTTDTTALKKPMDGYTDVVQWGDGYKEFSYKKLNAVDGEQLTSEGYTAYPMTDGTFIYLRKDGETVSYIDAKTSMLCTVKTVIDESFATVNQASRRGPSGKPSKYPLLDGGCLSDIIDAKLRLFKQKEQMEDSKDVYSVFKTACATIEEVFSSTKDALGCIYDAAMQMLQPKADEDIRKCKIQGEADLNKAEDNVAKWKQKIADKNTFIKQKEKYIETLQRNEKTLAECVESGKNPYFMTEMTKELNDVRKELNAAKNEKKLAERFIKNYLKPELEDSKIAVRNARKFLNSLKKNQNIIARLISKLPRNFRAALAMGSHKALHVSGAIAKFIGTPIGGVFKVVPLAILIGDNWLDIEQWSFLSDYIEGKLPCPGDQAKALQVYEETKGKRIQHTIIDVSQVVLDAATLVGDFCAATVPVVSTTWWLSLLADCTSIFTAIYHPRSSADDQDKIRSSIDALECDKKPEPEPTTPTIDSNGIPESAWTSGRLGGAAIRYNHPNWNFKNVYYVFDPSGYVYEAVSSNRIEGVQTTCYYKDKREDMYGDIYEEAVVWDAAQFAQENPLFTDAEGRYQWDVPKGLWQVKYEKEGYETTYSDWLPVPPPQLEVNVGITQYRQPNVQKVKAYTDGIDITFDKYMDPQTLTTDNILLTANGQQIAGTIQLLNAEAGYQKPDVTYASKVRLNVNSNLSVNDKVQLTVRRAVESYAGVPMEADFTQQFDVEQRITALTTDSMVNMAEDSELTLLLHALPATAAQGRKVTVSSSDSGVVTTDAAELTLDQNGEAHLTIRSQAQGSSIIRFTLADDEELTTTTLINVRNSAAMTVSAPRSSRLNGITLYQGSEIQLTCATAGATILYTLNGSCPCDAGSKSVYVYDAPIVITGDSIVIKAMAVANGMEDSPVVEFRYKGIPRPTDIEVVSRQAKEQATPVAYYRLDGRRTEKPQRGLNIMRQHDGAVRKIVVK